MQTKIFVINLDRDAAKLARMAARLDALGLEFERFPAISGAALSEHELQRWRPNPIYWLERRTFAIGEIGNVLSHRALMNEIETRGLDRAVVLEDDVDVADDFGEIIAALPALSARYDVVKLEALDWMGDYRQRPIGALGVRTLYLPRYAAVGCAGYCVTRRAAQRLGAAVPHVREPFDHTLTDYPRYDLRFAEVFPHPVRQADGMSEISVDRIAIEKHKPNMAFRTRKKGHKIIRAWRQKLYELRRLGLWTLWTPPEIARREGRASHVATERAA